ncbi:hypothetical protein BDV32DRAFT_125567 [Aspergillus pseudonomiae]|nr:hypothetical protein BDV32DRAFT_125567 [Aspergillus pseudonomiae]
MQQALAILALYLSALAVGQGLPMNNFIPPPRPPHPPPVELIATNLHKNCKDFEISSARRDGSVRRPGSPDSTASYSGSEARRMRRADDVDGDVLIANCKNPQGIVHEVTLSLNRCFGWDPENIGLTAQLNGYGLQRGGCVNCRYARGPQPSDPGTIFCTCKTNPRLQQPNHNIRFSIGGVIQYNARSGLISCHGVEGTDLGPVPPAPRGDEAV